MGESGEHRPRHLRIVAVATALASTVGIWKFNNDATPKPRESTRVEASAAPRLHDLGKLAFGFSFEHPSTTLPTFELLPTTTSTTSTTTTSTTEIPRTTIPRANRGAPRSPATTITQPPTTEAPQPTTSSDYQPYPECMQRGHFDAYGNDLAGRRAEMIRCWDPLVRRWSWPSIAKVFSVMWCESKGDPWAGPYHPYHGLMQIGPGGPFDPWANMAEAWRKSSGGTNWSQWDCG